MSRSKQSAINIVTALIGQSIGLIISFFARIVFIQTLGAEYLGLNGLFTNILSVLSLANLGIGEAINFSLYRPLAKKDTKTCQMLMQFYKKAYSVIGCFILAIGILITPFLHLFTDNLFNGQAYTIFLLFVTNSAISYFFSYKRNLIIADQKRYIATIYRYSFFCALNIIQIIYLLFTKNYVGFLALQIISTSLENIFVSLKANQMYPYLKSKQKIPLKQKLKTKIIKNTKAMVMHKIGGTIVYSTDNILISRFIGLKEVGIYSNYFLITNALNLIFSQIFNSIIASIGNLFASKDKDRSFNIFQNINFVNFWIYSVSSICLLCLINPFIELWVGQKYCFTIEIVLAIVISFYITGMRKTVLVFREASGLFYQDRWKAIIEAVVNLVTSIIFTLYLGIFGIFLGTIISSATTCLWIEPYVLYKYAFHKKLRVYFQTYFKYLVITLTLGAINYCLCSQINNSGYLHFIIKTILVFSLSNLVILLLFYRSAEFQYFYQKIYKKIKHKSHPRILQ